MSRKYKIRDQEQLYFVTFTVVDWIDIFIRDEYRSIIIESIKYCQVDYLGKCDPLISVMV